MSTSLLYCTLLICMAASPSPMNATGEIEPSLYPEVETHVDRNEILIGDVIHLSVSITHDPSVSIIERNEALNLGQFEMKEINPKPVKTLPSGRQKKTIEYVLSTYFTGKFTIPAFTFQFRTEDGAIGEVQTVPITINVRSLTPEESEDLDIRDIKEPVVIETPGRLMKITLIVLGIINLIITLFFIWRFLRQLYPPRAEVEYIPPGQAHERALDALSGIRQNEDYFENKNYKAFSSHISEVIRVYINRRWQIHAMDLTTDEIMNALNQLDLDDVILGHFRTFFETCDLIKFAKYEPSSDEMNQLVDTAKEAINQTKLEEEAIETQPEKMLEDRPKSLFSSFFGDPDVPVEVRIGGMMVQALCVLLFLDGLYDMIQHVDWAPVTQLITSVILFWFARGFCFGYRICVYYTLKDTILACSGLVLLFVSGLRFEAYLLTAVIIVLMITPIVFAYLNWKELH